MSYADAGHRPHAVHTGEQPQNPISYGPEAIKVTLTAWGPQHNIFPVMYDALQANWGDKPSDTRYNVCYCENSRDHSRDIGPKGCDTIYCRTCTTGWCRLTEGQRAYIDGAFAGKTLPQILEGIKLHFTIDGVTRAFTHQNVRTRIGAAFMQHGGRDNDWRHRAWTMPETIRRACEVDEALGTPKGEAMLNAEGRAVLPGGVEHCITSWAPIDKLQNHTPCFNGYARDQNGGPTLRSIIEHYLAHGREIYVALVDAGIPWQDARRVLWMGTQTYIHDIYDYLSLQSTLSKRLEHVMDWEHNCVAQLMVREVAMKCPPVMSKYLVSMSDRQQRAAFAGLESWPPDMKYDPDFPCECGHTKVNHATRVTDGNRIYCKSCERDGAGIAMFHLYKPVDPLQRAHRPEQNPFWVLHPESMRGGPIVWVPTNGTYPTTFPPLNAKHNR